MFIYGWLRLGHLRDGMYGVLRLGVVVMVMTEEPYLGYFWWIVDTGRIYMMFFIRAVVAELAYGVKNARIGSFILVCKDRLTAPGACRTPAARIQPPRTRN